ncbi:MAG: hypothetical protein AMK70_02050 [Nitrospira bacterium SG8_35_1]|nr:MAG: hypothetical protein AMK70_02050 [Nitrospira bacterium SG8_35_1]
MVKSKILQFIYLLFAVTAAANCQSVKDATKFVGHYVYDSFYGTNYDLKLLKDGTFQFIVKEGLSYDTIGGNWNVLENRKIVLSPPKTNNYHIESECDTCNSKYYIRTYSLIDRYELTKPSVEIYNKGTLIKDGIINAVENTVIQNTDSIKINYFGFETYAYIPQNTGGIVADVFLKEVQQGVLQKDRILKIKKSKLITEKGIELTKQ